jgi:hypothetical protein
MNKAHFLAAVMFAASVLVTPQETPKKGAALQPAPSASEALLVNWNEIGRKLTAMAEDFPEDKYDFKPAPSARTFAERLLHAAAANYFFTNMALGQKAPSEEDPKRELFKSKADLVAYVKKSFADGAAAIKSKGDQGISGVVVDPFAQDVTGTSRPGADTTQRFGLQPGRAFGRDLRPAHGLLPCGRSDSSRVASEKVVRPSIACYFRHSGGAGVPPRDAVKIGRPFGSPLPEENLNAEGPVRTRRFLANLVSYRGTAFVGTWTLTGCSCTWLRREVQ